MIAKNYYYTKIAEYLNCYCTQKYEVIPKELPCVYFRVTESEPSRYKTFGNTDDQMRLTAVIEVFSEGGLDPLVEKVKTIMKQLNFRYEFGELLPNGDSNIDRYSMRFQRIVCGGDTI